MKFDIFNRFSGAVQFTAEIDCADDAPRSVKVGLSVKWAIKTGARLVGASLDRASLDRAKLDGASLDGASLVGASLVGASLDRASLDGASLDGAKLDGAKLDGARLDGARLVGASLRPIRADVFDILLRSQKEVTSLLASLRSGKINGSAYEGECACLCGTIANARGVSYRLLGFTDASRAAERWFTGISIGDTPSNNQVAKITEAWILEFMSLCGIKDEAA